MDRVTTRPRGSIPGIHPAPPDEHIFPHDPGTDARTNAWLDEMRRAHDEWQERYASMGRNAPGVVLTV